MNKYEERYYAKRRAGISGTRKDGSKFDPEVDKQAGAAEEFAAGFFGAPVNDNIMDTVGDGGKDFDITLRLPSDKKKSVGVEVVWLGFRQEGNLLVNPFEPQRYEKSDIFVLVRGTIEDGFEMAGWATKQRVEATSKKDFGYGPRYHIYMRNLQPVKNLLSIMDKGA